MEAKDDEAFYNNNIGILKYKISIFLYYSKIWWAVKGYSSIFLDYLLCK
jgi:hypothetical protein